MAVTRQVTTETFICLKNQEYADVTIEDSGVGEYA